MFICLRYFLIGNIISVTATTQAEEVSLHYAAELGDTTQVRRLLKEGIPVDTRDNRKRTPLIYAASRGHVPVVQMLIARGANLYAQGTHKLSPLNAAIARNHIDVINVLMQAGIDIHLPDANGCFPLFVAVEHGQIETVNHLLQLGTDPNTAAPDGRPVLQVARRQGPEIIAQMLIKHGAELSASNPAIRSNANITLVDTLIMRAELEKGAPPNRALHLAVALNDTSGVRQLLDYGVLPDARDAGGITPLMTATKYGLLWMVRYLITHGADIYATDESGKNALAYAVLMYNPKDKREIQRILRRTMYRLHIQR